MINFFFRNQIRGLRAQYQKEVSNLKALISNPATVQNNTDGNLISYGNSCTSGSGTGNELAIKPIGFASTWHHTKNGTPRQGCIAKNVTGILDISVAKSNHKGMENPQYSLEGLEKFSHIWILFHFDQNHPEGIGKSFVKTKVAPPRLKGQKVGLFSTRSPHRPNPIGLTLTKLVKIEGSKIFVQGLDLINNTPILDIKPYIPNYDIPKEILVTESNVSKENEEAVDVIVPDWIEKNTEKADTTSCEKISVIFTPRSSKQLSNVKLNQLKTHQDLKEAIVDVLKEDPRSNYRREKCSDRLYYFTVDSVKITCWFDDQNVSEILKIENMNDSETNCKQIPENK